MNQVLKWLNNHEALVHMSVMFVMFYGLPLIWVSAFQPNMVSSIIMSGGIGLSLIFVTYAAYWCASAVTRMISDAVARAALEEIRDTSLDAKIERPRLIDLEAPTTLVVENLKQETREAVENLKQAVMSLESTATVVQAEVKSQPESAPKEVPPHPVEKKKRAPRAKSVKKEG